MKSIKNNGIVFYDEKDLFLRDYFVKLISLNLKNKLKEINKSIDFRQIESSILINKNDVNLEYFTEKEYVFETKNYCLRPETTKGSYAIANELINHYEAKLPLCIWQYGKSFRNEQDKTYKNIRLKEFYQLEFQLLYSNTTKADYPSILKQFIFELFKKEYNMLDVKMESSDRLPTYSLETTDIIVNNLEICSMSLRNDFNENAANFNNFEIAIGLDRLLYLKNNF